MKIVLVTNEHDQLVSVPKRIQLHQLGIADAEVHVVDFETVRSVLPVTTAPCVFVLFDELQGDFDLANIGTIRQAVTAANIPKPPARGAKA